MTEHKLTIDGRSVTVKETGAQDGSPVVYFHGTPGSRLEPDFGDQSARDLGARVICFDRPGYGGSDAAPFGLATVAEDTAAVVDALGIDTFATLGQSGGGPFALAAAAVLGERVTRVGVASGPGPFQEVPGALESLDENDAMAATFLPDDPQRAAEVFALGFEGFVAVHDDEDAIMAGVDAMLGESDADVVSDPRLRPLIFAFFSEAMRQGPWGGAWDNVAWIGRWDTDVREVPCPVHLWYGERDEMAPPVHGQWLAEHLPRAELVVRPGEGHLGVVRHWQQMLQALTASS